MPPHGTYKKSHQDKGNDKVTVGKKIEKDLSEEAGLEVGSQEL